MEAIRELTSLIAAHGVYALSVIFIFYLQRRAVKHLTDAQDSVDKKYFRKVNTSVIVATYVLVAASTSIWFYATFMHEPVRTVTGEVIGLRKSMALGAIESDGAYQQLAPERGDLEFYPVDDVASLDGGYKFRWALLAKPDVHQLAFRFVHRSLTPDSVSALSLIAPVSGNRRTPVGRPVEKRFVLDLDARSSPGRIQLTYTPDEADPLKVGKLWMSRADGSFVAVEWASQPAAPATPNHSPLTRLLERFSVPLLAEVFVATVFRKDGSYDASTGRSLAIQLGSADLRTRLTARRMLVEAGPQSYRFINDVLDKKVTADRTDWPFVLDSLSNAIDEIEVRGTPFAREGHLKLAAAFYDGLDYKAASYHFEKAGDITAGDPVNLARRGHSYAETGSMAKAVQAFNEYLAGNLSRDERLWTRNALGVVYRQAGRFEESVAARREALKIDANFTPALNGLAYTYAKQGKNLSEALALVDRALKLEPGTVEFLGTRGYVLYKLGRFSEALPLVRLAAARLPNDPDTQSDLREVEQGVRSNRAKTAGPVSKRN